MSHFGSIILLFVNLISSGLVEFAISNCCESDKEIECCSPPIQNKNQTSDDFFNALGCCCDESASHFYYYTAKFQSSEKDDQINPDPESISQAFETKYWLAKSSILEPNFNIWALEHKIRNDSPILFRIQYDVWLI